MDFHNEERIQKERPSFCFWRSLRGNEIHQVTWPVCPYTTTTTHYTTNCWPAYHVISRHISQKKICNFTSHIIRGDKLTTTGTQPNVKLYPNKSFKFNWIPGINSRQCFALILDQLCGLRWRPSGHPMLLFMSVSRQILLTVNKIRWNPAFSPWISPFVLFQKGQNLYFGWNFIDFLFHSILLFYICHWNTLFLRWAPWFLW